MAATLSDMPPEIGTHIAAHLSPADQRQLFGANRQYRRLFQQKQDAQNKLRAKLTSMLGTPAEFNAAVYAELKKYANANDYRFARNKNNKGFGDSLIWFEYDGLEDVPVVVADVAAGYTFVELELFPRTKDGRVVSESEYDEATTLKYGAQLLLGERRYNLRMPDGENPEWIERLDTIKLISSKTFASVLDHLEQHNVQFCEADETTAFIDDLCNNVIKRYYTLSAFTDRAIVRYSPSDICDSV